MLLELVLKKNKIDDKTIFISQAGIQINVGFMI